jgi:hypothetical protein
MMLHVVVDLAADELDRVHERIAGRFGRAEPRARMRGYVSGLLAGLERKNGWTLAEQAGEAVPDGMQRLLRTVDWDVDGVRDDVRDYVTGHLGDPGGVLIADLCRPRARPGSSRRAPGRPGCSGSTRGRPGGRRTARSGCSSPTPRPAGTR